jgi:cation:H+ antiporter
MIVVYLAGIIFFSFVLVKATELLIQALDQLTKSTRLKKFALTSLLLALATSLPELFVSVSAALANQPGLALGNILGSNIADMSLVIGGAAIVGGSLAVSGEFLKQEIFYTFLAGALPLLLLIDNYLSRLEGILLILVYGAYNYTVLWGRAKNRDFLTSAPIRKFLKRFNQSSAPKHLAWVFIGVALLLFSADWLVRIATAMAYQIHLPVLFIGLFLISLGTSLPELSFEIAAVRKKEIGMVFGDLLGSVVANSTLILGLTALIRPIQLEHGLSVYFIATIFFAIIFSCFWFFVRSKKRLDWWEGLILIMVYLLFIIIEYYQGHGH